jgi:hypothetical protein
MYARPVATVRDTVPPCVGAGVTVVVVAVRYLSPAVPVGPVTPVAPVGPVLPVGPSIPSRFTLYIPLANVPLIFVIESMLSAPVGFV